jgi:hypothetical protein
VATKLNIDLVEYASRLRQRGLISVPVVADSKHIAFNQMGLPPYHAATANKHLKDLAYYSLAFNLALRPPSEADVARWFAGHSGNIGIIAGYRGLVILDFDDEEAFRHWQQKYSAIFGRTAAERTPRGFHIYLASPVPVLSTSLYFGSRKAGHIKGLGGYVVCSPSQYAGPIYEWFAGQSPLDVLPARVADLSDVSIYQAGWLKRRYDGWLRRGLYEPAEPADRAYFGEF